MITYFSGRTFSEADLLEIQGITSDFPKLSRSALAEVVCESLGWYRPNGAYKKRECYELLNLLEDRGLIKLPPLRKTKHSGAKTVIQQTEAGSPKAVITGDIADCAFIEITRVTERSELKIWNELIDRYHYLGYKVIFGARLHYLIYITIDAERHIAGCLQFSSPAWRVSCRDRWIGWDDDTRRKNLQYIVNNSRFLILPWVRIKNLASKILSMAIKKMPFDWEAIYGIRPVLIETFVDKARFQGRCYIAANWIEVGHTTGRGRMDRLNKDTGKAVKKVFLYPLKKNFRKILLS